MKRLQDKKSTILDIAMNLNRIGNYAADNFEAKRERVKMFISQTSKYVDDLKNEKFNDPFKKTYQNFLGEYRSLEKLDENKDKIRWAEKMMTWGNILTHRAKLIR